MNSKEALYNLITNQKKIRDGYKFVNLKTLETATVEDCYDTIMRDLEVLDIIKRSIYSRESHKYVLNEKLKGQKFMNVSLYISGDTDYNKVKEWLDHD